MPGEVTKSLRQKIEELITSIISAFIGLLLAMMVIFVFSNVIGRYFFNSSIAWTEEITRIMFIWLIFLGSYLAYIKNEHLGLDILIIVLPKKISQMVLVLSNILVIVAIGIICYGGWSITAHTFHSGWTSPALAIPYGVVYMIVPFSGFLLLVQSFIKLAGTISNLSNTLKGAN